MIHFVCQRIQAFIHRSPSSGPKLADTVYYSCCGSTLYKMKLNRASMDEPTIAILARKASVLI